jgi:small-conductance mechanosensitive channel
MIIISKDFLLSIVAFFIITRKYAIGDTIALGEMQGQIIFIRTFSVGVLGKDNDGDSTGKLFEIPSFKFITETVRKEELKTSSIRKEIIRIPFMMEENPIEFSDFLKEIKTYLDENLPVCNRKNAGNYQTYIGYRYKLDIDYLEDKCILITVGIVGKWENNVKNKEKIIGHIESYRKKYTLGIKESDKN